MKQNERQRIRDKSNTRRYFSQIPHIADDDMNPYEMRLYVHYLRVCGEDGECWEGRATTAKACQMSAGMVTKTRTTLAAKGWITLERGDDQNDTYHIQIVDRWHENMTKYAPAAEGGHVVTTSSHTVTTGGHVVTQRITSKEEPIKEKDSRGANDAPAQPTLLPDMQESKSKKQSPHQPVIDAYVQELGYTPQNMGREAKAAKWLVTNAYTPEQVIACYRHMKADKFWTDKPLSLQKVADAIPEFNRTAAPVAVRASFTATGARHDR